MKRYIIGLGLLFLLLCSAAAVPPPANAAAPVLPEEHPSWIPVSAVPPELLEGRFPRGAETRQAAIAMVAKALGKPYTWIAVDELTPLYFRDPDGTYGYVALIRLGVILTGSMEAAQGRVSRGLYDQIYHVRARAVYKESQWQKAQLTMPEPPTVPVPRLPEGGPQTPQEEVRGWNVPFAGEVPEPPIGSGLNLADAESLRPLLEQLALYPAHGILAVDSADTNLLMSTQMQVEAVVVAGLDSCAILFLRTVNAYKRAPWMDSLWGGPLSQVTDRLDDAARAAGVTPDRVATQRLLLKRGADGWQVAESKVYQGAYGLTVAPPTVSDRVIGGLETVQVIVPARVRDPEPVDPVTDVTATAGATAILVAWASAQLLGRTSRSMQILRQAAGESTGSRLAKAASDALDWIFRPVEKPLERLVDRLGLAKYFHDEPDEPIEAMRKPAGETGFVCVACGSPVRDEWAYCSGCGAHLQAGPAAEVAAAAMDASGEKPAEGGGEAK